MQGSLAHVHLRPFSRDGMFGPPPVGASADPHQPEARKSRWTYDDMHRQLILSSGPRLLCWDIQDRVKPASEQDGEASGDGTDSDSGSLASCSPQVHFLSEGEVVEARFSPDRALLAVQRNGSEVEFINQQDGSHFVQKCKLKPGSSYTYSYAPSPPPSPTSPFLLGFFWVVSEKVDLVLVTQSGLEMYKLLDSRKGLQLKEVKKHASIKWYKYSTSTKLLILATGNRCNHLLGYQITPQMGVVKLPKFDIATHSDTHDAEGKSEAPCLRPDDIFPVVLYRKLFCCHLDGLNQRVVLYRLYKDAIRRHMSYPTYSSSMGVSVVDDLLLVHHTESMIVMVFDIMNNSSQPFVSPLPVRFEQPSWSASAGTSSPTRRRASSASEFSAGFERRRSGFAASDQTQKDDSNSILSDIGAYSSTKRNFHYFAGCFVLDVDVGMVWFVDLDLDAIAVSCPNTLHTVSFLHRREPGKHKRNPKELVLSTIKTMIQERESLPLLKQVFDMICFVSASHGDRDRAAEVMAVTSSTQRHGTIRIAVDMREMCTDVFHDLEESQCVEPDFLLQAMETFYLSVDQHKLRPRIPPAFDCLMVDVLTSINKTTLLTHYLSVQFFKDSELLAQKLQDLAQAGAAEHEECPGDGRFYQFAFDMYFRLKMYDECCAMLLVQGRIFDALKMLKEYHLNSISPAQILDKALTKNDFTVFASVYRFCNEFVPGFDTIAEKYSGYIHEMSQQTYSDAEASSF